jgi:serine/threonine protein kinase
MVGRSLAQYEIISLLGQGGMGTVYQARDTKLGRDVALKFVTPELAQEPERLARFEREARSLAALNHGNIAAIYGIEEIEGQRFLVMELVDGEDLSVALDRGPITIEQSIEIARQLASGIEAAHEQGIVHRDLKPANIKIGSTGEVKILDFGLARAYTEESGSISSVENSPTITAAMTQAGVILGTASYMSPEQARGRTADKRADIWSFGVVLFEMLSGSRLFKGETVSDTVAEVLKTEIDYSLLPDETPAQLIRLLKRCLDRQASTRLRDIGEARVLLTEPIGEGDAGSEAISSQPSRGLALPLMVGLAGLLLGAALVWALQRPAPFRSDHSGRSVVFSLEREEGSSSRSAISDDGSHVALIGLSGVAVRPLNDPLLRWLPETQGALVVDWSSDGDWLAYATHRELFKIRADGTGRVRLCGIASDLHEWAGSVVWTDGDRILFTPGDSAIWEVAASGGDPRQILDLAEGEVDIHNIAELPEGRGLLFLPHIGEVFDSIHWTDGQSRRELFKVPGQTISFVSYTEGYLLFVRRPDNPGIWAVPFSLDSIEVTGEPFLVRAGGNFVTSSRRGDLSFQPESQEVAQIVRLDARGKVVEEIGEPVEHLSRLALSPAGDVAAGLVEEGKATIWIFDLEAGDRRRFLFDNNVHGAPSWSLDGTRLVYSYREAGGERGLAIASVDGSIEREIDLIAETPSLSNDGGYLMISLWNENFDPGIAYLDLQQPDAEPVVMVNTTAEERSPLLSSDGRLVTYQSSETGRSEIFLRSFPDGKSVWQLSPDGGRDPRWSVDGAKIHYLQAQTLMEVDVAAERGRRVRIGRPRELFSMDRLLSAQQHPDGGYLALRRELVGDAPRYEIWLNWLASLTDEQEGE